MAFPRTTWDGRRAENIRKAVWISISSVGTSGGGAHGCRRGSQMSRAVVEVSVGVEVKDVFMIGQASWTLCDRVVIRCRHGSV